MPDPNQAIGRRIRYARQQQGLTQAGLGTRLGVSHVAVSEYERGTTRLGPERVAHIAGVLGVEPAYLYGFHWGGPEGAASTDYQREEFERILGDLQAWAAGVLNSLDAAQARIQELQEGKGDADLPS